MMRNLYLLWRVSHHLFLPRLHMGTGTSMASCLEVTLDHNAASMVVWRLLLALLAFMIMSCSSSDPSHDDDAKLQAMMWKVPFYYPQSTTLSSQNEPDTSEYHQHIFHELHTALRHYREMSDGIINQLAMAHEVASRTEQLFFPNHDTEINRRGEGLPSFLSAKVEHKITMSAQLLEQNIFVLERLLKPCPIYVGSSPHHSASSTHYQSRN